MKTTTKKTTAKKAVKRSNAKRTAKKAVKRTPKKAVKKSTAETIGARAAAWLAHAPEREARRKKCGTPAQARDKKNLCAKDRVNLAFGKALLKGQTLSVADLAALEPSNSPNTYRKWHSAMAKYYLTGNLAIGQILPVGARKQVVALRAQIATMQKKSK